MCCSSILACMEISDKLNREGKPADYGSHSGIATYYKVSAVRRRELEQKALAQNLHCKRYPQYFEVRFCELIFNLIDAHRTSWNAVALQGKQEQEAPGYLNSIRSKAHLELAAFLRDVLLCLNTIRNSFRVTAVQLSQWMSKLEIALGI